MWSVTAQVAHPQAPMHKAIQGVGAVQSKKTRHSFNTPALTPQGSYKPSYARALMSLNPVASSKIFEGINILERFNSVGGTRTAVDAPF